MSDFLYIPSTAWSSGAEWSDKDKPWDHAFPFHRIHAPNYDKAVDQAPASPSQWRKRIDGKGCACGCHSKDDYTPGFLDDLFKKLLDLIPHNQDRKDLKAALQRLKQQLPNTPEGRQAAKDIDELIKVLDIPDDIADDLGKFLEGLFFAPMLRRLPAWVPVDRQNDTLQEMEGFVFDSFQDWNGVPLLPWHKWYDWNFHVVPFRGYQYLQSEGNRVFGEVKDISEWSASFPGFNTSYCEVPMQCRWDLGALGLHRDSDPGPFVPPMIDPPVAAPDPLRAWLWPQPGQYVWLAGRWVYNCMFATREDKDGLMRSELHPCRAIATARWEGFKFKENPKAVPAIRFMFFASTKGGYVDTDKLAGAKTYEFIVDLPPIALEAGVSYPIGHTPEFALNTIVLGPQLLMDVDFQPFRSVLGEGSLGSRPEVELLPAKAGDPRRQAKVTVTLGDKETYGFVLSMGWRDPSGAQAASVKKVTVRFDSLKKFGIDHVSGAETWRLNLGVNGRWVHVREDSLHNNSDPRNIGQSFTLLLPSDESVTISAHGLQRNGEGALFDRPGVAPGAAPDRTFRHLSVKFTQQTFPPPIGTIPVPDPSSIHWSPVSWDQIDNRQPGVTVATDDEKRAVSALARDLFWQAEPHWADPNDMLGLVVPAREPTRHVAGCDLLNPVQVRDIQQQLKDFAPTLTAYEWAEMKRTDSGNTESAELQFHLNSPNGRESIRDYVINMTITVAPQD
jgi:hypothetical protein